MIRRPPRSTQSRSSAASDVYKRQPPEEFERLVHAACRADDLASRLGQHVLELEGDERLILDNEDPKARESWDVCRVVHCLFVPSRESGSSAAHMKPRFPRIERAPNPARERR